MQKKKAYKNFIRFLAKIYVFFWVIKRKPKYLFSFTAMLAGILLAIAVVVIAINQREPDPIEELKDRYVHMKPEEDNNDSKNDSVDDSDDDSDSDDRWSEAVWSMEQDADAALWYGEIHVDIDELRDVNSDIIGWIYFEAADISYPVLYSGEDQIYLKANYKGKYETAGSIFLEGENNRDFSDKHMLIYGHNMKNETMFGQLKSYKINENYYENHQYFQLIYKDDVTDRIVKERYHIFAFKDVAIEDDIYWVFNREYSNLSEFVDECIRNNNYLNDTDKIKVTDEDKVITLSTCSADNDRFVVSAVKCGECTVK